MPRSLLCTLVALLVLLAGTPAAAGEVAVSEAARAHFRRGVELLGKAEDKAGYRAAHAAFRAAYDDSPSVKMLGNLGLCAFQIERYDEARWAYTTYLADTGGLNDTEVAAIKRDLALMEERSGQLQLTLEPAAVEVVDERRDAGIIVINRYSVTEGKLDVTVRAGTHVLRFAADGYEAGPALELALEPGQSLQRSVALQATPTTPPPAEPPEDAPNLVPFGVAAGITGVLAIAASVTTGVAFNDFAAYEDEVQAGTLDPASPAGVDRTADGESLSAAADGLWIGAGVGAAVSTVLLIVALGGSSDEAGSAAGEPAAASAIRWQLVPGVARGQGSAGPNSTRIPRLSYAEPSGPVGVTLRATF